MARRSWLAYPSAQFSGCSIYLPNPSEITAVLETMDGQSVIMLQGGATASVAMPAKTVMAALVPPPDQPMFVGRLNPDAPTATFSGAADPGSTIVIRDGAVAAATATTDATGQWETTAPVILTPGSHTLIAIQTDIFGRQSKPSEPCVLSVPEPPPPEPLPEPAPSDPIPAPALAPSVDDGTAPAASEGQPAVLSAEEPAPAENEPTHQSE